MKKTIQLLPLIASIALTGCEKIGSSLASDSYQFVTAPNGDCFIFHPKTGKIVRVAKDGLETLGDTTKVLQIGDYYRLSDASGDQPFVKYIGGGKFEAAKFAIKEVAK